MAAGQTGTAALVFYQSNRQLPRTKGDRIPDVLRVVGGVGVMTGTTGPPLGRLVDMYVVQVLVAVTETGKGGRFGILYQGVVVTVEAEFVVFGIEFGIENRRIVASQDPEAARPVGVVAA